jgi:hypothetical protein
VKYLAPALLDLDAEETRVFGKAPLKTLGPSTDRETPRTAGSRRTQQQLIGSDEGLSE